MRLHALSVLVVLVGCAPETSSTDAKPVGEAAEPKPAPSAEKRPRSASTSEAEAPPPTANERVALDRAKQGAKALGGKLTGELHQALADTSPAEALSMCAGKAQGWTNEASADAGLRVGRSSLRLRNAKDNAAPDWVRAWLEEQGERPAEGVQMLAHIEQVGDAQFARFIKPIPVGPACLNCHGPSETLSQDVRDALAERYPDDEAVGYALGDLRGALWAEAAVRD